jgi:hypothetical protein
MKFKAPDIENNKVVACPISYSQVDKRLIKAYSGIVLIVLAVSFFLDKHIGLYLITIDFMIRVFMGIKYSPLCNFLTLGMRVSHLKPKLVNAGAKKIAAIVGLLFSVLITLTTVFSLPAVAALLTLMFMTAILIDLIFDYCLACKMQRIYLSYLGKFRS